MKKIMITETNVEEYKHTILAMDPLHSAGLLPFTMQYRSDYFILTCMSVQFTEKFFFQKRARVSRVQPALQFSSEVTPLDVMTSKPRTPSIEPVST